MEIHQLRYFVAVAEEGSFSQAAEREHVSQPSLSQQIQKLEDELNQKLFDRLPRAVVLTEAGRCLLDYARQILTGLADARRSVAALEQEVAGRLSVGAVHPLRYTCCRASSGNFNSVIQRSPSSCLRIRPTSWHSDWRTGRWKSSSRRQATNHPRWSVIHWVRSLCSC